MLSMVLRKRIRTSGPVLRSLVCVRLNADEPGRSVTQLRDCINARPSEAGKYSHDAVRHACTDLFRAGQAVRRECPDGRVLYRRPSLIQR